MPINYNFSSRNLTPEQQRLITMYVNQYNQTNAHIDMLLDMLDEIRGNIVNVINSSQPRRTRINRHSRNANTNINRLINQMFNDRQNNYVHYDYNEPINPSIYNDYNMFTINDFANLRNRSNDNVDMSFNGIPRNNNNNINNNFDFAQHNNDLSSLLTSFLNSTVIVRPTTEQIQNASRLIRYGDIDNPLSESCPISLDEFNDDDQVRQLLPCGHIFHQSQFQEWFNSNVRCPVCRYDIRNYRPLSRRNTPNNLTPTPTPESQTTTTTPSQTTPIESPTTQNTNTNNIESPSSPLSNINVVRDPLSNQIDHLTFDITDQQFTNNFIDRVARNIFQSMLNPHSQNNNDRFMIDPSNNILFYETIIRPNNPNNDNN